MRLSKARKEFVTAMMKDTIFEAAGSVLAQYGPSGITMDRVATTAGLATGSLYNYFQDKDDLLQFIFARIVEPLFQPLEEAVNAGVPAPQKLEQIIRAAVDHGVKHKSLIRLLASSDQESKVRRTARARLLELVTSVFERGIIEGSFRPHKSLQTGRLFLGVLSELLELQASDASTDEVSQYVEVLIDVIRNGLSLRVEKDPRAGNEPPSSPSPSSPTGGRP
jgi:AcrR family transcriptional regulator